MTKIMSRRHGVADRTAAELVTLSISLVLLALLIGSLLWLEWSRGNERARISVTPDFGATYRFDGSWYLPVAIVNEGDRTTDQLLVNLERAIPGEQPEVAELGFTFVAGGEQVEGTAVFDERPTPTSVTVDVVGVTDP